jgi:nicotinate-nucleotide adenylyltransferase
MRIGLFGGTFDPFHLGHIQLLTAACRCGQFDKILVVPTGNPPHKMCKDVSMFSYRYEITRLSLSEISDCITIELSDLEMDSEEVSYTLNTVNRIIISDRPEHISLICGSDVLYDIPKWHKPSELLKRADLFVLVRPGFSGNVLQKRLDELSRLYSAKVTFLRAEYVDISSSKIRVMIQEQNPDVSKYLSKSVYQWVLNNKIYHPDYSLKALKKETIETIRRYERMLFSRLSTDRLIHSINTMKEAIRLAVIFGVDPDRCAIAGLLHDCAKYSDPKSDLEDRDFPWDNSTQNDSEKGIPEEILHAYTGKDIARTVFRIFDEDILNAIYYHTTSRANASEIEIVIYVADKIEPGRNFPNIEHIRDIAVKDIRKGHYECLRDIIKMLKKKNKSPHRDTKSAYEMYKNERWFTHEPKMPD